MKYQFSRNKAIIYILFCFFLLSCTTGTQYLKPGHDKGSSEWGPREIKTTVDKMVSSLYKLLKSTKKSAYLDVTRIRNRTSEHIDTKMLSNELITNLIKKRIKFIDRSKRNIAMKEIQMGQTGIISEDSAIPAGALKSPNYILSGDVTDNVRYVSGNRVQYLVTTLRLTEIATGEVVWQEQKKFLKSTKEHKMSW